MCIRDSFKIRQNPFSTGALRRNPPKELTKLPRPPSRLERGHPSPYPTPLGTDPTSALAMRPPRISARSTHMSLWRLSDERLTPDVGVHIAYATSSMVISERELKFMFAICHRPSVCLSSVTLVHPTQAIVIFGNISTPCGTMAIHDLCIKILPISSQGNPSVGGVNEKRGSRI